MFGPLGLIDERAVRIEPCLCDAKQPRRTSGRHCTTTNCFCGGSEDGEWKTRLYPHIAEPAGDQVAHEPNQAAAIAFDLHNQRIINGIDLQNERLVATARGVKREVSVNSAATSARSGSTSLRASAWQ
jgi:hypothetical protein